MYGNEYKVSLEQLYSYLPDLHREFESWTGKPLPFVIFQENSFDNGGNDIVFKFNNYNVSATVINGIFPESVCENRRILEDGNFTSVIFRNSEWSPNFTQRWTGPFDIGDICIVPALEDDKGFNIISTMFALSYTYGMMARYFPSVWISLGRVEKGDRIFPLVHRTLSFLEEKFPLVVLDFLRAPYDFEAKNNSRKSYQ